MISDTSYDFTRKRRIILGAAFLSAISAFGPSLMTQVAVFSEEFGSAFVWVVLITGIINIVILCAAWLLVTGQGKTVTELADDIFRGYGVIISVLFSFCCVCFNIGNICGIVSGLGLLLNVDTAICALIAGALCLLFVMNRKSKVIDFTVSVFAFVIVLVLICALAVSRSKGSCIPSASLPDGNVKSLFVPAVCMLFGSYIPFIGGQTLLSQGVNGRDTFRTVLLAAIASASVTLLMRLLMTLTDLAVISRFGSLGESNPASAVFVALLKDSGRIIFAVMQIIISVSCVYASTSCFNTFTSYFTKKTVGRNADILLVVLCTAAIILWGRPVRLMVIAGIVSGVLTPLSLLVLLITGLRKDSARRRKLPLGFTLVLGFVFVLTTISVIASFVK